MAEMKWQNHIYRYLFLIIFVCTLCTCGGGGGGGPSGSDLPSPPTDFIPTTLIWEPPTQYVNGDNVVNSQEEIGTYRIYVKTDTNFTDADSYVEVPAIDNDQLVDSFDLRLAASTLDLQKGVRYYVAMRVVSALDINVVSDFSVFDQSFSF
jgi:hypothetical protein